MIFAGVPVLLIVTAWAVLPFVLVGGCILASHLYARQGRRRAQHHAANVVRLRLDDFRQMPAPDEIPRARDLTRGEVRQLRGRQHPVPRKRRSRSYGA